MQVAVATALPRQSGLPQIWHRTRVSAHWHTGIFHSLAPEDAQLLILNRSGKFYTRMMSMSFLMDMTISMSDLLPKHLREPWIQTAASVNSLWGQEVPILLISKLSPRIVRFAIT